MQFGPFDNQIFITSIFSHLRMSIIIHNRNVHEAECFRFDLTLATCIATAVRLMFFQYIFEAVMHRLSLIIICWQNVEPHSLWLQIFQ